MAARVAAPQLQGWSEKQGMLFVQPPVTLLEQLIAVRVHIDDCGPDDGPLRVVPGSHLRGRVGADIAQALRDAHGEQICCATCGAALVMRPLLLHASSKSRGTSRRRVLHFLFGPPSLPHGLAWRPLH